MQKHGQILCTLSTGHEGTRGQGSVDAPFAKCGRSLREKSKLITRERRESHERSAKTALTHEKQRLFYAMHQPSTCANQRVESTNQLAASNASREATFLCSVSKDLPRRSRQDHAVLLRNLFFFCWLQYAVVWRTWNRQKGVDARCSCS